VSGPQPPRARPSRTRERIVEAFTERARTLGPRSVVMAELARDLGISTRTLYKHFRSKAELMHEVMGRFAEEWRTAQQSRFDRNLSVVERLHEISLGWLASRDRFSATFWRETRQLYPEAIAVWHKTQLVMGVRARDVLGPALRDDVPKPLSVEILYAAVNLAADADRCDRLGISRHESVRHAVELWARGALKRADLRLVPPLPPDEEPRD